jgi:hypothetical protein
MALLSSQMIKNKALISNILMQALPALLCDIHLMRGSKGHLS